MLAALGALAFCPGAGAEPRTTEFSLDNGLRVIVQEDHRSPVVINEVWYKVGSSYESTGHTGISHALEHMMFKGTSKVPAGEFSRIVNKFGGSDNAFTTSDFTGYYQLYAADRLPLAMELEADRMANLLVDPKEFASEIHVVMEERHMRTDDNPQSRAWERFTTIALPTSAERIPPIGWQSDLDVMTAQDLKQWYNTWYAPNNATLVVVGDVDPTQVRTLAQHYFGAIPSRPVPAMPLPRELPEPGHRVMTLNLADNKVPVLYLAYNVPSLTTAGESTDEAYVLRMLVGVLDEGVSARLETRLVRQQQVASEVSTSYDLYSRGDTLLTLVGVPAEGHTLKDLHDALLAEVDKLKSEPISSEEMQRVYADIIANNVFARDSISSQAGSIGSLVSVGLDWRVQNTLPQKLQQVTPEQIQAAARKYLIESRLSELYLQAAEEKKP